MPEVISDPRRGLPSASSIERRYLCAGSANAERGLDEQPSDDADSGTRIHAALAGDVRELEKLSSDEHAVYEHMRDETAKLVERHGFDPNKFVAEKRLWFPDEENPEFSGQPDRVYLDGPRALVANFKSGFLPNTTAEKNPQLATEGVLVIANYGVARCEVAIIPRFGPVKETAAYDLDSATQALEVIRFIIAESQKLGAPRKASDKACKYCRAALRCPEFQAYASTALAVQPETLPAIPADKLALAIDRIPAALKLINDLKAEGKRRIAAGDEEFKQFYELTEGRTQREIINLPTLFTKCREMSISDAAFTAACSLSIGEVKGEKTTGIKGLVHLATNLKGAALDKTVDEVLAGCVRESTTAGSLKRKE
jgi:hypothetical protein